MLPILLDDDGDADKDRLLMAKWMPATGSSAGRRPGATISRDTGRGNRLRLLEPGWQDIITGRDRYPIIRRVAALARQGDEYRIGDDKMPDAPALMKRS